MLVRLWDPEKGEGSTVDIPDEVLEAARLVEQWMVDHKATLLHGLKLSYPLIDN